MRRQKLDIAEIWYDYYDNVLSRKLIEFTKFIHFSKKESSHCNKLVHENYNDKEFVYNVM